MDLSVWKSMKNFFCVIAFVLLESALVLGVLTIV